MGRRNWRTLSHNNTTHKNLNRPDPLQRNFTFTRRLPQSHVMTQFILTHSIRVIDFVSENKERNLGEFFHCKERVKLGFGLGEAFVVFGVDEEDDAAYFGEVVFPEAAGCSCQMC